MKLNHIAIICSDYEVSKRFYVDLLGFEVLEEEYRKERGSYRLELSLNNNYLLELFSFPQTPPRPTQPEACGLRHIAFGIYDFDDSISFLRRSGVEVEAVRYHAKTKSRFTFCKDPDGLPIELVELAL